MDRVLIIENWLGGKINHLQLKASMNKLVFEQRNYSDQTYHKSNISACSADQNPGVDF